MPRFIDLSGTRFGRLVALKVAARRKGGIHWECICDCGTQCVVATVGLRHGGTQSCGCLYREVMKTASRTHGLSSSGAYRTWTAMKSRCYRKTDTAYSDYGGRGITVCDEWRGSFEAFFGDMGHKPPGTTIERKDPNGAYTPGNCIWATRKVQSRNRRSLRIVSVDGRDMCLAEAIELYGQTRARVRDRLKNGWDLMRALSTPALATGKPRSAPL